MAEDMSKGVTLRWGQLFQWIALGLVVIFAMWQHLRLEQVEKQLERLQAQGLAPALAPAGATAPAQPPVAATPSPQATRQDRMAAIIKEARESSEVKMPAGVSSRKPPRPPSARGREQDEALSPEEIAQRRLSELQTIVGEGPLLQRVLAALSQEASGRRQLEQQAREGTLSREALRQELEGLRRRTDEQVEAMLEPKLFDRYRELRQSWSKGRPHPDRDSRE